MGKRQRRLGMVGLALSLTLVAAACGGGGGDEGQGGTPSAQPQRGGVWRTAVSDFGFTGAFDPTAEYLGAAWEMYTALTRTLMAYKFVQGADGTTVHPDLAASEPEISSDGLTYTFKLKPGVKFGPPVNRAITSKDIKYAFQRINTKALTAGYGFYYTVIEGLTTQAKSPDEDISGITTPDDQTIVFKLKEPAGDFLFRLAQAATAPIPVEVAKCATKAGEYGRFVVSSGPYMIKGSDAADISSCSALKPFSGFDPTAKLEMVRNPNYDQATDELRKNWVDGISIVVNSNVDDIFAKVQSGELDASWTDQPPKTVVQQYVTDPAKKNSLHIDQGDRVAYIHFALTEPPFDDVHVRKAANFVLDKASILQAWGGSTAGEVATHIMPDSMTGGQLGQDYNPYASPDFRGDEAKAKEEMKQSKYDSDKDGVCDDPVCKNIVIINRNVPTYADSEPFVVDSFAKIGVELKPRELATSAAYTTTQTISNKIKIGMNHQWGKDYADSFTFIGALFGSPSITPTNNTNVSFTGLTQAQADEFKVKLPGGQLPPSVDSDIAACQKLTEAAQRVTCYNDLDKKIMEEIAPWIPFMWLTVRTTTAPSVTKWQFDQFAGVTSLTQVAVNNNATL
jgi:peptide/nickel transport system substrate-binding protein